MSITEQFGIPEDRKKFEGFLPLRPHQVTGIINEPASPNEEKEYTLNQVYEILIHIGDRLGIDMNQFDNDGGEADPEYITYILGLAIEQSFTSIETVECGDRPHLTIVRNEDSGKYEMGVTKEIDREAERQRKDGIVEAVSLEDYMATYDR